MVVYNIAQKGLRFKKNPFNKKKFLPDIFIPEVFCSGKRTDVFQQMFTDQSDFCGVFQNLDPVKSLRQHTPACLFFCRVELEKNNFRYYIKPGKTEF